MADVSAKPVIFLSYSRKDEPEAPSEGEVAWLTYVQSHLAPAVKSGVWDLFVDQDMQIGIDWRPEIEAKLNGCDLCVLLASRHSLASDFILDVEMKRMLERRKAEGTPIFPILLSAVSKATTPKWIWELNVRPTGLKPLARFPLAERDEAMAAIVDEIAGKVEEIAAAKTRRVAESSPRSSATETRDAVVVPDSLRGMLNIGERALPVDRFIALEADHGRLDAPLKRQLDEVQLSDQAGAALLRASGVWGRDAELRAASRDFGGLPIVLVRLARALKAKHFGDVRRRADVRAEVIDDHSDGAALATAPDRDPPSP